MFTRGLTGFLGGLAVGGLGGYYFLHQDIWRSAEELEKRVRLSYDDLVARIEKLEKSQ
jgi:hypothetical protein